MHPRAAHLLEGDLLADHHLGHARRAEVHRRVALAHDHDVAERRDVGAAGSARPEQHADLRHDARELDLVVEDPPRAAAAGEHLHLLGDPRARRVHEVDHRDLERQRAFLDAQDLLDRLRPPRAGLDRGVVRHQRHRPPVDRPHAGHDAVRAETVLVPVREQRLLGERALVQQQRHALAHRELALLERLLAVALGPPASARSTAPSSAGLAGRAHLGSSGSRSSHLAAVVRWWWRCRPPRPRRRRDREALQLQLHALEVWRGTVEPPAVSEQEQRREDQQESRPEGSLRPRGGPYDGADHERRQRAARLLHEVPAQLGPALGQLSAPCRRGDGERRRSWTTRFELRERARFVHRVQSVCRARPRRPAPRRSARGGSGRSAHDPRRRRAGSSASLMPAI